MISVLIIQETITSFLFLGRKDQTEYQLNQTQYQPDPIRECNPNVQPCYAIRSPKGAIQQIGNQCWTVDRM